MHHASVIVPTYNKAPLLDLTLASYLHQTHDRFELIVVDDGSTDTTREVVERYREQLHIKYVHQPNRGRSAARNRGIVEATGDILVFSDDDRIVAPDFLAAHVREFSSPRDNLLVLGWQASFLSRWEQHPDLESRVAPMLERQPELAPLLARPEKLQLVSAEDIRERFSETLARFSLEDPWWDRCVQLINSFPGDFNAFRLGWSIGTTGNMAVSRQRTLDVGLFDESFSRWGLEDTDLCFRLCQEGARIVISREALNYHQLHARSPTWMEDWNANFARFWAKSDSVQIPLFYLCAMGMLSPHQANAIVLECEALEREGRTTLVAELKRVYRMAIHVPSVSP